ncbi:MAG: hypothetical protein PF795_02190 [Kiritimatiellae bacterium]|jgi:hypothetical protein|nr:hypothetical protein [Kiritimatiellia bacterium]
MEWARTQLRGDIDNRMDIGDIDDELRVIRVTHKRLEVIKYRFQA